jgi:hypothetical protein
VAALKPCPAWLALAVLIAVGSAAAQDNVSEENASNERSAQVEQLRAQIANAVHLQANDLVDELVFGWTQTPPFDATTSVILADVVAPLGYGSGFEAMIENHLAELLLNNPGSNVQLAHCPSCSALLVHSDTDSTIISRGMDSPRALTKIRGDTGAQYALFLDFEAEGSALVLRARVTRLSETLPIVAARTLTTKTSAPALLRSPTRLISSAQARQEYVSILEERSPLSIPVKVALSAFAPPEDQAIRIPVPVPWVQIGAEYALTQARAWKGSLVVGATWIPQLQAGAMVQARIMRLISGTSTSLTHPNLYAFVGIGMGLLTGDTAQILNPPPTTAPDPPIFGPSATWLGLQGGLDVRVTRRVGVAVYLEIMPTLYANESVGDYLDAVLPGIGLGVAQVNSIGGEAIFAF